MHPPFNNPLTSGQPMAGFFGPGGTAVPSPYPVFPLAGPTGTVQFPPSRMVRPAMSEKVKALLARPLSEFTPIPVSPGVAPTTHAALVLDKSVSMSPHRDAVLTGFGAQVRVIQAGAKAAGRTLVTLNQFSTLSEIQMLAQPAEQLRALEASEYVPDGGSTALFDAIGFTIERLLDQPDIDGSNTAVLLSGFTDGAENDSKVYSAPVLRALIDRLSATGRWTVALMGPSGTVLELADLLNLSRGNVSQFDPSDKASTVQAFNCMAAASASYMSTRGLGATQSNDLYR